MTAVGELITPTGVLVMDAATMHEDRAAWLAARRWRDEVPGGFCIGASDVASILDLDGVDTPAHVFREKVYEITREATEPMIWGSLLEDTISREWCARNHAVIDEIGLVASVDRPWLQATIDRRVFQCPVYKNRPDGVCGLETKLMGFHTGSRWHSDLIDRVYAQILVQLAVTGLEHIHWACLVGGNNLKQGIVYADREADVTAYILGEVERFRTEHLLAGIEPAWDTSGKADRLLELDKATHPDRIGSIGIDGLDDVLAYVEAQQAEAEAGKRKKRAAARLAQLADGREIITVADNRAYWYGETRTTRVKIERLAEKYPDAFADPEVVYETVAHPIHIDNQIKKML